MRIFCPKVPFLLKGPFLSNSYFWPSSQIFDQKSWSSWSSLSSAQLVPTWPVGIDVGRQWAGGTLIYQLIPPLSRNSFSGSYGHINVNLTPLLSLFPLALGHVAKSPLYSISWTMSYVVARKDNYSILDLLLIIEPKVRILRNEKNCWCEIGFHLHRPMYNLSESMQQGKQLKQSFL